MTGGRGAVTASWATVSRTVSPQRRSAGGVWRGVACGDAVGAARPRPRVAGGGGGVAGTLLAAAAPRIGGGLNGLRARLDPGAETRQHP